MKKINSYLHIDYLLLSSQAQTYLLPNGIQSNHSDQSNLAVVPVSGSEVFSQGQEGDINLQMTGQNR